MKKAIFQINLFGIIYQEEYSFIREVNRKYLLFLFYNIKNVEFSNILCY